MTIRWMILLAFPLLGAAPPPDPVALDLELTGLRSSKGDVRVCIWHGPEHFLAKKCADYGRVVVVPAAPVVSVKIDLMPGEYAVSLIHDANGNGKLDKNLLGIPTEGVGFSRNPVVSFGPPSYAATAFAAQAPTTETIKLKYFL